MRNTVLLTLAAVGFLGLVPGCKVVKNPDPLAEGEVAEDQSDAARMAALAEEIWEPKVLPAVAEHLVPLAQLRAELAADAEAAGTAHGLRPEGEANPWNFAVSGSGTIVEGNTSSRAAKLKVDTDADGKADVIVQLGPVIRGTAIRDAMPFLIFTDFRDQIEFAKLAGGLNAAAHSRLTIPEGDVVGQNVTFEGVFTMRQPSDVPEIVPTALSFGAN